MANQDESKAMFDRLSVRVIAGALLWSTALILFSIAFHGRFFGVRSGVEDIPYMQSLIWSTVTGSFVGVFFGAFSNSPRHPLWINVFAAATFVFGLVLAPALARIPLTIFVEPWRNGLTFYYLLGCVGAVIGGICTPLMKKLVPFGTK